MTQLNDTSKVDRQPPTPVSYTEPFWEATREKKLMLQFDPRNKRYQFHIHPVSIHDGLGDLELREAKGTGEIFSWTIVHRAPIPFRGHEPFAIAMVTLKEGVNIMVNVINCVREELRVGLPVKLCWLPLKNGTHLPAFEPVR